MFKLHLCVKLANFNVIQIKRRILLRFVLFTKMNVKKYDKMIFWQKWNYRPFQIIFKKKRVDRLDFFLKKNKFRRRWSPAHNRDRLACFIFVFAWFFVFVFFLSDWLQNSWRQQILPTFNFRPRFEILCCLYNVC